MFSNFMAIIEFLNLCSDVYLWLDDKITDLQFKERSNARKEKRKIFISSEKEILRLEVLRDLERNDPRRGR